MKEAPVLIFVMNDLGCRLDPTLSWDERVSGICYAPSIDAAVENRCLTADSLELGSLWICNTYFACPELCHTLKSRCEPICALALGYAAEAPLNRLRKAFADAVKFCDSLLGCTCQQKLDTKLKKSGIKNESMYKIHQLF